ncbi:unnamed protein product [marine sediment metagenome]|uniref:Uncharacterized protein n=1 Tax=marine sediment metagenome TaxID=412755 RepID=X0UEH5_9ZZZZ
MARVRLSWWNMVLVGWLILLARMSALYSRWAMGLHAVQLAALLWAAWIIALVLLAAGSYALCRLWAGVLASVVLAAVLLCVQLYALQLLWATVFLPHL